MIAPNTSVLLLSGVPFDNTYTHTVYYPNRDAQHTNLTQHTVAALTAMTYQRYSKNSIRVQLPIEKVSAVNYMAYKNTNYENKWIYAFVTHIEYVNDVTTELFYEIDVMQTYFLFDTTKEKSYVLRCHSTSDEIGDNILPEPVNSGEYLFDNYAELTDVYNEMAVIAAVADTDGIVDCYMYDGNLSGCKLYAFPVSSLGVQALQKFLEGYVEKPEAVVSLYTCPSAIFQKTTSGVIPSGTSGQGTQISLGYFTDSGKTFEGYTPKNKKLYTYPYNFLHVDNGNGESLALRYEFFDGLEPQLRIYTNFTYPPTLNLIPLNYRGTTGGNTEKLTISNFPQASWANDSWSQWTATQAVPTALSSVSSILQVAGGAIASGVGAATANPLLIKGGTTALSTGASGLFGAAVSTISQAYTASIKADVMRGSQSTGNANIRAGLNKFFRARCHITGDFAKMIDDFFSVYGYTQNKIMSIPTHNRANWTYVQTAGANLHGNCGVEYTRRMQAALDNGITFWNGSISKVGNYAADNSII